MKNLLKSIGTAATGLVIAGCQQETVTRFNPEMPKPPVLSAKQQADVKEAAERFQEESRDDYVVWMLRVMGKTDGKNPSQEPLSYSEARTLAEGISNIDGRKPEFNEEEERILQQVPVVLRRLMNADSPETFSKALQEYREFGPSASADDPNTDIFKTAEQVLQEEYN